MKRAIISVSDKTGIVEFAKELETLGFEIVSTGGTYKKLKDEGVNPIKVDDITDFPECLGGRVKTLHPKIHGGILAERDNNKHLQEINDLGIIPIDLVVVNLYPFKETILKENITLKDAIENIDIGGPTMLRAAAKNYKHVLAVTDPVDYDIIIKELKENDNEASDELKLNLAVKVFEHTAHYDALINSYLKEQSDREQFTETITFTYEKVQDMRYGENPHQAAAFYKEIGASKGLLTDAEQLHGKELSFNNINDTHGALELLKEFDGNIPTIVASKHSNPCGVGSGDTIYDAYIKAYEADPVSIYGGIVVSNTTICEKTANEINKIFVEILLAPDFTDEALSILKKKKNIRILKLDNLLNKQKDTAFDFKKVSGGLLVQNIDNRLLDDKKTLNCVTERHPTEKEMEDLLFAWKVVKYAKSNGIAIGKDGQSLGIGPGQVNRVWALKQSIDHCKEFLGEEILKGAVLASDAFFPFADCVEAAAEAGITAIIQPGGSIRDKDSIELCNKKGIAMIFTGMRHFRH